MAKLKNIVYGAVAILILFILASTIMLPEFRKSWQYCQNPRWRADNQSVGTNCTNEIAFNNTPITSAGTWTADDGKSYVCGGDQDCTTATSRFCVNCDTLGGYRTSTQGLVLLILVMGIVGIAVAFIPKLRK